MSSRPWRRRRSEKSRSSPCEYPGKSLVEPRGPRGRAVFHIMPQPGNQSPSTTGCSPGSNSQGVDMPERWYFPASRFEINARDAGEDARALEGWCRLPPAKHPTPTTVVVFAMHTFELAQTIRRQHDIVVKEHDEIGRHVVEREIALPCQAPMRIVNVPVAQRPPGGMARCHVCTASPSACPCSHRRPEPHRRGVPERRASRALSPCCPAAGTCR